MADALPERGTCTSIFTVSHGSMKWEAATRKDAVSALHRSKCYCVAVALAGKRPALVRPAPPSRLQTARQPSPSPLILSTSFAASVTALSTAACNRGAASLRTQPPRRNTKPAASRARLMATREVTRCPPDARLRGWRSSNLAPTGERASHTRMSCRPRLPFPSASPFPRSRSGISFACSASAPCASRDAVSWPMSSLCPPQSPA